MQGVTPAIYTRYRKHDCTLNLLAYVCSTAWFHDTFQLLAYGAEKVAFSMPKTPWYSLEISAERFLD